jgi:hypothetical protein
MLLVLASEIAVLRDRLDTHERLAEVEGAATVQAVDEYAPGDETGKVCPSRRNEFLHRLFRPLRRALGGPDA